MTGACDGCESADMARDLLLGLGARVCADGFFLDVAHNSFLFGDETSRWRPLPACDDLWHKWERTTARPPRRHTVSLRNPHRGLKITPREWFSLDRRRIT